MTTTSALRNVTMMQVMSAGLALSVAGSETFLSGLAMMAITAVAWMVGRQWPSDAKIRKNFWNLLALLALAGFLLELMFTQQLLPAVARLVVFLTAFKLFTLKNIKDYFTLLMLGFLQLLATTSISYDYRFAIPFVLFVITSCVGLMLLASAIGHERERVSNSISSGLLARQNGPQIKPKRLWRALTIALVILILTAVIFPILPRFRAVVMGTGKENPMLFISGFGHVIDLDSIGRIKRNPHVVMRVRLSGPGLSSGIKPKLRGIALTSFDGQRWTHSTSRGRTIPGFEDGDFRIAERRGGPWIEQDIILAPLNTRVVFAAKDPVEVQGSFGALYVDRKDSIFMMRRIFSNIRYSVLSEIPDHSAAALRGIQNEPPSDYLTRIDSRLPRSWTFSEEDGDRIRNLAKEITAGSSDLYESMKRLEQYLKTRYTYSLDLTSYRGDRNKMISFLFDRRTGHCEFFASAMVLLARSLDVQARLVNGFQIGQYNPIGGFYTVRAADAHSWVEIYFPGAGWVEFDPTPSSGQESEFAASTPDLISGVMDSIDLLWSEYVLAFDPLDQQAFFSGISGAAGATLDSFNALVDFLLGLFQLEENSLIYVLIKLLLQFMIAIAVAWMVYLFLLRPLYKRLKGHRFKNKTEHVEFFEKTVQLLRRHGYRLRPTDSAREFAGAVAAQKYGPLVTDIVASYEIVRFSEDETLAHKVKPAALQKVLELKRQLLAEKQTKKV